jgi:hypothetical protein
LSEASALTADRVDLAAGVLVFDPLKKRQAGIYRAVPVPLPCSTSSTSCTASVNCTPAEQGTRDPPVALVAYDWLARRRALRSQGYSVR